MSKILEVPKLGSPERPSEGVDTSKPYAKCKYCHGDIFEGEGVYTSDPPAHWACYQEIMKAPAELDAKLASFRKKLEGRKR